MIATRSLNCENAYYSALILSQSDRDSTETLSHVAKYTVSSTTSQYSKRCQYPTASTYRILN